MEPCTSNKTELTPYRVRATARQAGLRLRQSGYYGPPVILVTDPQRCPCPEAFIHRLPCGYGVIYRHFGETDRHERACNLVIAARKRHLFVQIAADPDLTKATRANGIHWPERLWRGRVGRDWRRRFIGKHRQNKPIITIAAHSRQALSTPLTRGADAALVSPVFASDSSSAGRPIGRHVFRCIARYSPLPCYALGGMGKQNAQISGTPFAALASLRALFEENSAQNEPVRPS